MHLADNFYSLNTYYRKTYGEKVYKIAIDGGFTCPNRDGSLGTSGCIFCSQKGSGDFSIPIERLEDEIQRLLIIKKANKFIVYFQAFTNTYAPLDYLKQLFEKAISYPHIVGIAIATRPDCLPQDVINYLSELNTRTDVYIELGLQTIHETSAQFIRRGFSLGIYDDTVSRLIAAHLPVVVHIILGLPNESIDDILATVKYVVKQPVQGIKLQLLHILKQTDLYDFYREHPFHLLTQDEYCDLVVECIHHIPKNIVIHRITGDGSKKTLYEPTWSLNKKSVLNSITQAFNTTNKSRRKNG